MCKIAEKFKIKNLNSPRNKPLIILKYWSNNIEETFRLRNPDNNNISNKSTTQDLTNVMNATVNHVNYMGKFMIVLQEKFIGSDNERLKKSICIYQLVQENISTKPLHLLLYLINDVHAILKQLPEPPSKCTSLMKSASNLWKKYIFLALPLTLYSPIKKWYHMLYLNLLPKKLVL